MMTKKPTKGNLLFAEPSITGDIIFNRAVVLLADHGKRGSVGFILNKPLNKTQEDLLPEVSSSMRVYHGGPVEEDILYFIHRVPKLIPNSVEISSGIYWGGDFSRVVDLLSSGMISEHEIRFFLGYSGWDVQQLNQELNGHTWIVADNEYEMDIIKFSMPDMWKNKMIELGGEYILWSNAPENPVYN